LPILAGATIPYGNDGDPSTKLSLKFLKHKENTYSCFIPSFRSLCPTTVVVCPLVVDQVASVLRVVCAQVDEKMSCGPISICSLGQYKMRPSTVWPHIIEPSGYSNRGDMARFNIVLI
jgi:hypothetical protein